MPANPFRSIVTAARKWKTAQVSARSIATPDADRGRYPQRHSDCLQECEGKSGDSDHSDRARALLQKQLRTEGHGCRNDPCEDQEIEAPRSGVVAIDWTLSPDGDSYRDQRYGDQEENGASHELLRRRLDLGWLFGSKQARRQTATRGLRADGRRPRRRRVRRRCRARSAPGRSRSRSGSPVARSRCVRCR